MRKNKFQKLLFIALTAFIAFCLTVALVACAKGNDDDDTDGNTDGTVDEIPADEYAPEGVVTTTKLVTYDGPNLLTTSAKVGVKVDNTDLFVYETRVNHSRTFSYGYTLTKTPLVIFDFEGKVTVEVEVKGKTAVTGVTVSPRSYGIEPKTTGNIISFDLSYTDNYTLEFATDTEPDAYKNAVHIFASEIEKDPIDSENLPENTVYIGPGVYEAGALPIPDGGTLYLAGGAYVYGQVRTELLDNVTIRGRGIISGEIYERTKAAEYTLPFELRNGKNLTIEGITILDPAGWAITLYKCDGVTINNVKIITARANGDGISVQSCSNVTVNKGFVRTWDDSLVVKNTDRGITDNIVFDGTVVWTDLAQSCEVGFETNGATMNNITFKNITILHAFHKAALSIHNSDDAVITNVNYTNITIEDAAQVGDYANTTEDDFLLDITIAYSEEWTKSGGNRGSVRDVTFANITVLKLKEGIHSRFAGESSTAQVNGVSISNLIIEGTAVSNAAALNLALNDNVKGVVVSTGDANAAGAVRKDAYVLELADDTVAKTVVASPIQNGVEVPSFAILNVSESYMGVALDLSTATKRIVHGYGTTNGNTVYEEDAPVTATGSSIDNLFDIANGQSDKSTSWASADWKRDKTNEFYALEIDFGAAVQTGIIRIYMPEGYPYISAYNVRVFTRNDSNANWLAKTLDSNSYKATPATGNYFDVKIPGFNSSQIQLRFYRVDGLYAQSFAAIGAVSFYPISLSTNKAILDSSAYADVYQPSFLIDGNDKTYWEAATKNAYAIVDLGAQYTVNVINLHLPPLLTWEPRNENFEILISLDNVNYTELVARGNYLFDPMTGNFVSFDFRDAPAQSRYIKIVWYENTSLGGYGAQLSEILVYGE
ncbi:MAG: discoidin domain-containing protein [Christensenellaceae bacterium]|jgi:hypothetical protein|nr:discoidin domain-containing protein [Christensenellaceae bacterium]